MTWLRSEHKLGTLSPSSRIHWRSRECACRHWMMNLKRQFNPTKGTSIVSWKTIGRCGTSSIPPIIHRNGPACFFSVSNNSKVERMFSLKVVKTDHHTSLQISTLDDLMEINIEGPPTPGLSAEHVVDLWWPDCARRPNQRPRKSMHQGRLRKILKPMVMKISENALSICVANHSIYVANNLIHAAKLFNLYC